MSEFKGKICLVAGNLGKIKKKNNTMKFKMGLGGEIAKKLIIQNARVILLDLNFKIAQKCAESIGKNAEAMECDLLKDRTYETKNYIDHRGKKKTKVIWKDNPALKLIKNVVEKYGKIDVVITNFDYFKKARLVDSSCDFYDKLKERNITPIFHLMAAVREQFSIQRKKNGTMGKIVIVTSIFGKAGLSLGSLYSAFKSSMIGLTKSLAREFARFANVNAVATGPLSERKMQGPKERVKNSYLATQTELAKQPITAKKIAPLVSFLASDDAIAITGQVMNIDAGMWLKLES